MATLIVNAQTVGLERRARRLWFVASMGNAKMEALAVMQKESLNAVVVQDGKDPFVMNLRIYAQLNLASTEELVSLEMDGSDAFAPEDSRDQTAGST